VGVQKVMAAAAALACVVLTCCATRFQPYEFDGSGRGSAQLELDRGFTRALGHGGVESYLLSSPGSCASWRDAAEISLLSASAKTVDLPTGDVIRLLSTAMIAVGGGSGMGTESCWAATAFVPLPGHRYRARLTAQYGRSCPLELIDLTDGRPVGQPEHFDTAACAAPQGTVASELINRAERKHAAVASRAPALPPLVVSPPPPPTRVYPPPAPPVSEPPIIE
jgi:hypothetical protein